MSETQLHVFAALRLLAVLVEVGTNNAHYYGVCPAWCARNVRRFVTLVFGVAIVIDPSWQRLNAFCFAMGLLLWNLPKDSDPPKRRRRKEAKKEETSLPNWSGVPEAI